MLSGDEILCYNHDENLSLWEHHYVLYTQALCRLHMYLPPVNLQSPVTTRWKLESHRASLECNDLQVCKELMCFWIRCTCEAFSNAHTAETESKWGEALFRRSTDGLKQGFTSMTEDGTM